MTGSAGHEERARRELVKSRRIVVKIGSKALATDRNVYERLAMGVEAAHAERRSVVLVSSGAIALGLKKLGLAARPREIVWLQAAAAVGQTVLMRRYEETFAGRALQVAQVLLTHADLADRARANNTRNTLAALLEAKVVPIINENDSVAVEEIKFGENDLLASMIVPLVDADLLILLSDVPGLLNGNARVALVSDIAKEARPLAGGSSSGLGTGGMKSKVEAAQRATLAGAHVVVASALDPDPIGAILRGESVGTLFVPPARRIHARKHWIAFTLRPRGALVLDRGAVAAVVERGRSVLAVGVVGVRGEFSSGDAVSLLDVDGHEIGRGLARLGTTDAAAVAGRRGKDLADGRPNDPGLVVVHRDDMVVLDPDHASRGPHSAV